jgi:hypothetical protein
MFCEQRMSALRHVEAIFLAAASLAGTGIDASAAIHLHTAKAARPACQ